MALVTVQRSPSVTDSPQCSNSDGEADDDDGCKQDKSESFFAGKATALVLALTDIPRNLERRLSTDSTRSSSSTQSNNSDIQQHLQSMFYLLRHEETLKMAVKLESQRPNRTRYLVITSRCCFRNLSSDKKLKIPRNHSKSVEKQYEYHHPVEYSTHQFLESRSNKLHISAENTILDGGDSNNSRKKNTVTNRLVSTTANLSKSANQLSAKCDPETYEKSVDLIEESCLLGIDCNEKTTIGLVVPILADTTIHLDGDGGFSVTVYGKTHIFKPVSVQAMWSALQTLHKVSQKARENNFYPCGPSHDWLSYYESRIESEQSCLNEWNAMDAIESRRPPSPDAIRNKPTEKEETKSIIKMKLKEIMMSVDLDEVTSKYIRGRLEEHLDMDLAEYKSFIDEEMLTILGQMDAPTEIFEHVYLGSEWNASNLEELQKNGVRHILNVTREIDNFFPGMFDYFNVRVYDDEKTNLLKHWDNTYKYITRAQAEGSKVLVHCKMGVSRSASVVIAYAMKAYNWEFNQALQHVKERRNCIKPNKNFLTQLETYRGMLDAMKNKEKLQRSKSETNLKTTKDARLLPGSEPTPLIQALNHSKSKATLGEKQRKLIRRSSSTSPKSIRSNIIIKQQSQSLENLTPERSFIDEPKNVRFPGSNGENYSVTQNQVLHIQKNASTSVKNIISGLEYNDKKTADDKKCMSLQIDRSLSGGCKTNFNSACSSNIGDACTVSTVPVYSDKSLGSPVWTSSAKIITQTSNIHLSSMETKELKINFVKGNAKILREFSDDASVTKTNRVYENKESRKNRKIQSWTPTTFIDETFTNSRQSSNSSVDSAIVLSYGGERREIPSRHSSWGSGDNRTLPSRNSSWGSYDTNKNPFYNSAIFEGQIQDMNKKTARKENVAQFHFGTVKRTKQKLEECTVLKKLCQDSGRQSSKGLTNSFKKAPDALSNKSLPNTSGNNAMMSSNKRNSNLYRSQSEASSRTRYSNRCNSEEIVTLKVPSSDQNQNQQELSVSAPESYTVSDTENQKTSPPKTTSVIEGSNNDEKLSGHVQILKKNFEAKAGSKSASMKGQSLPSSPVAQHTDTNSEAIITAIDTMPTALTLTSDITTTDSSTTTLSSSSIHECFPELTTSASPEPKDRNVKGLVSKYQSTGYRSNHIVSVGGSLYRTRPRSYYESRSFCTQRDINHQNLACNSNTAEGTSLSNAYISNANDRPPPVPPLLRNHSAPSTNSNTNTESILTENIGSSYHRRVQQHGKTHPLARLSLPKQRFNAAAYNTM